MSFLNIFTKNQFLKYYMNIGSNVSNLNRSNSFFILGLNFKISILNIKKILIFFKKKISFVFKYSKMMKFLSFLLINITNNKILSKKFTEKCSFMKCSYFFGPWWNGLLKNFKVYLNFKWVKKINNFKFFNFHYPNFVIYVHSQKYGDINKKKIFINDEINKLCINNIMFFNDYFDIYKNPSVILNNTKSFINNLFLFNMSIKIIKKSLFIYKKSFYVSIFNFFNFFKLKKKLEIFFESIFCLDNKKNYFKSILWNDDLK